MQRYDSVLQTRILNDRLQGVEKIEGKHFVYTPLHGFISEEMAKEGLTPFDLIERETSGSSSDSSNCEKSKDQLWKRQKLRPQSNRSRSEKRKQKQIEHIKQIENDQPTTDQKLNRQNSQQIVRSTNKSINGKTVDW